MFHRAFTPSCLCSTVPLLHHVYVPPCLYSTLTMFHRAFTPPCLCSTVPLLHPVYVPLCLYSTLSMFHRAFTPPSPQWGAADAEIKVSSGENTELKRSPFNAWSRSVYSHTCYAYCQEFLPCLFLPFRFIHLHFFQNPSRYFFSPVLAVANTGSCVGPQSKISHLAE